MCKNKLGKPHIIRNRSVLDSLAEEGHVVMLKTERVNSGRQVRARFDWVGRNVASGSYVLVL